MFNGLRFRNFAKQFEFVNLEFEHAALDPLFAHRKHRARRGARHNHSVTIHLAGEIFQLAERIVNDRFQLFNAKCR